MNLSISNLLHHYNKILKDEPTPPFGPPINPPFGPNPNPPNPKIPDDIKKVFGMSIGLFVAVVLLSLILWIVAIVLLVQNWTKLPNWAKILGVLGVIPVVPLGPLVTIIAVLCGRQM
jgi:hypothetical protein